jgi:hypothetical protein
MTSNMHMYIRLDNSIIEKNRHLANLHSMKFQILYNAQACPIDI